jgi:hypothetical protein
MSSGLSNQENRRPVRLELVLNVLQLEGKHIVNYSRLSIQRHMSRWPDIPDSGIYPRVTSHYPGGSLLSNSVAEHDLGFIRPKSHSSARLKTLRFSGAFPINNLCVTEISSTRRLKPCRGTGMMAMS